jgi:hypothetical protein
MRLAEALLSVASEESRDVEALKNGALQVMALRYRRTHTVDPVTPKPEPVGTSRRS